MYSLAIHGGAGTILRSSLTPELEQQYLKALRDALLAGEKILQENGSALDAVAAAVVSLEDCPMFNAGKGSVFTNEGRHEMDAAIMRGDNLMAGAVAGVEFVQNPVVLARAIMEKSDHVMLSGAGAKQFAEAQGLLFRDQEYFHNDLRYRQWQEALKSDAVIMDHTNLKDEKFGTVGAVAMDHQGNLAAATSTGGMTNKKFNRIGDSPVIGAGTYANNKTCAVSCTGHGEFFLRAVVAYDISCLMEYKGLSLAEACNIVVHDKLVKIGGEGGLIAVDAKGNIELPFNSEGMYRGSCGTGREMVVAIYK